MLLKQDWDPTIVNFERKMLELLIDDQVLVNDARYNH